MQIHYCCVCNKRIDKDDGVSIDDQVYCQKCAATLPDEVMPLGRATPSRGGKRSTPSGPASHKTPARAAVQSPPRGNKPPGRNSQTRIQPAPPSRPIRASGGNAIPPARVSGANALPTRASGGSAAPARSSSANIAPAARKGSGGNPTLTTGRASASSLSPERTTEDRDPPAIRKASSTTLIWVLTAVALLLAGIGAALIVGGGSVIPPTVPNNTQTNK